MCGPTASTSTSAWRRPNPASWCSSGSAPTARRNWSRSRTYRESAESWADLMRDCARRGMRAPVLAVGDGALGFWKALAKVFPETHLAPFPAHRAGGRPTGPQTGKTLSCVLATTILIPAQTPASDWLRTRPYQAGATSVSRTPGPIFPPPGRAGRPLGDWLHRALVATAVEGMDAMTASQAFSSWIRAPRSSAHSSAHALSSSICREVSPYAV